MVVPSSEDDGANTAEEDDGEKNEQQKIEQAEHDAADRVRRGT